MIDHHGEGSEILGSAADEPEEPEADDGRVTVLTYAVAPKKAVLYRAVMGVFMEARSRYEVYRRPHEIVTALRTSGFPLTDDEAGSIETTLEQLVEWGNLHAIQQTSGARTLEEFNQRRFLYQITSAGERAERHIGALVSELGDQGALQGVMLRAITDSLEAFMHEASNPDSDRLFQLLDSLDHQFTSLANNASLFMLTVSRTLDIGEEGEEGFQAYKETLIVYIEGFLQELQRLAPSIRATIEKIEGGDLDQLFELAASADQAPLLAEGAPAPSGRFRAQWRGLRSWFVGSHGAEARYEALQAEARHAVQRLISLLVRFSQSKSGRLSRRQDLLALAHRFQEAESDDVAHAIFKSAFGLFGPRHLRVINASQELVTENLERPRESWWDSTDASVQVPLRLREAARYARSGHSAPVPDFGDQKEMLAHKLRAERSGQEGILEAFIARGHFHLSEIEELLPEHFRSLSELIAFAATRPHEHRQEVVANSRDGSLEIHLQRPRDGAETVLTTSYGHLRLPDYKISLVRRQQRVHREEANL